MPRIMIIDTLYDAFIRSLPFDPSSTYEAELRKVLGRSFGTADFYSRNLRAWGWDAVDVIANHGPLQQMWAQEHFCFSDILEAQIKYYDPDVILLQDLSIAVNKGDRLLAAQCSCPWPGDAAVKKCDVIFSSFPHYVPRIEALGVRAVYNPLAFEPEVLNRSAIREAETFIREHPETLETGRVAVGRRILTWNDVITEVKERTPFGIRYLEALKQSSALVRERIHDVVFIGGVGNPSHWRYGMEVLETVAREIPAFKWWGYGLETLPPDSALRRCYQGEAFGLDMYEILLQSKICLNRHGEVAEGYANNMRMFEATGCGALLLTEDAPNLHQFFRIGEAARYLSPADAVEKIMHYIEYDTERTAIANAGQNKTLRDHTYAQRMKTVSETLKEMLVHV